MTVKTTHKGRKHGDWVAVASMRTRTPKELINGRGLSNIPKIGEVGSAAYRRLLQRGKMRRAA